MALRREYTLGQSEFNEFLFAFVGEEKSGQDLTVLSTLARLGFDPWNEAARLAGLPKEAATRDLATVIGKLPEGDWKVSDAGLIAGRLVGCLPKGRVGTPPPSPAAREPRSWPMPPRWLIRAVIVAAAIFVLWQLTGGTVPGD